ncbi:unnamed protein product [Arctogadus glacialis]
MRRGRGEGVLRHITSFEVEGQEGTSKPQRLPPCSEKGAENHYPTLIRRANKRLVRVLHQRGPALRGPTPLPKPAGGQGESYPQVSGEQDLPPRQAGSVLNLAERALPQSPSVLSGVNSVPATTTISSAALWRFRPHGSHLPPPLSS